MIYFGDVTISYHALEKNILSSRKGQYMFLDMISWKQVIGTNKEFSLTC